MSTVFFCITALSFATASTIEDAPPKTDTLLDIGILGLGTLGYWGAHAIPMKIDNTRSAPTGLDSWVSPQWHPEWEQPSDFLGTPFANYGFNLPVLTTASVAIWGLQTQDSLTTAMPVAQAVAITGVLTEVGKRLVARPRPYTSIAFEETYPEVYYSDYMIDLRADNDTFKSFPSGHTSNAAATYFTSAILIANQYDNPTITAMSYGLATVLTGLTGYSRVRYGKHHISDTLVGATLGAGVGWGIAKWHLNRQF